MKRRDFLALLGPLAGCSAPGEPRSASISEPPVPPPKTRLVFGGDVMLSRYVGRNARQRNDPKWPLREMAPWFEAADIAFVNLESPFSERKRPFNSGMIFGAAPDMVEGMRMV